MKTTATPPSSARRRDAAATRTHILDAARASFARDGFSGARVERIAANAGTNVQMLYRYFGNKNGLYRAVLEDTYTHIRTLEQGLDLTAAPPLEGLRRLVEFTFDYMNDTPEFVAIIRNENMSGATFARDMPEIRTRAQPLMDMIEVLLERGVAAGIFTIRPPAMDLYLTILALCITHVAQRETLSVLFAQDLGDAAWLTGRRAQVADVVCTWLTAPRNSSPLP